MFLLLGAHLAQGSAQVAWDRPCSGRMRRDAEVFQKSWLYIKNPQESALLVSITFYTVLYLNRFLLLHVHFQYFTESGSQVAGEAQCSFGKQLLTLLSLCEGAPSPSQHFHWGLLASPAFPGNVSQTARGGGKSGQKGRGSCLHSEQEL